MLRSICFSILLVFASPTFSQCVTTTYGQSEAQVIDAYVAYYGRPPDLGGLDYWANRLESEGGNLNSIINAFGNSEEFDERYGNLSDQALINGLYQQLFGRDAEPGGLDYWTGELTEGRRSLQSIALDILNGAQNNDLTILNARRDVANHYVTNLANGGAPLSAVELASSMEAVVGAATASDVCLALTDDSGEQLGGIWYGTLTSDFGLPDQEVYAITTDEGALSAFSLTLGSQFVGTIAADGDDVQGHGIAAAPDGYTWNDGSRLLAFSLTGQIAERAAISTTWHAPSTGESGTLNLQYDSLYQRDSSLDGFQGEWVTVEQLSLTVAGRIQHAGRIDSEFNLDSGDFTGVDSFGCQYSGEVGIIDPDFNVYSVDFVVTGCQFGGTYSGLGALVDTVLNDGSLYTDGGFILSANNGAVYVTHVLFRNY